MDLIEHFIDKDKTYIFTYQEIKFVTDLLDEYGLCIDDLEKIENSMKHIFLCNEYYLHNEIEKAKEYAKKGAKHNILQCIYLLGLIYYGEEKYTNSMSLFKKCAKHSISEACYYIAIMYLYEFDVHFDKDKVIKYLRICHRNKYAEGQYLLGKLYYEGKKVNHCFPLALIYFKSAANEGHAKSQYMLASMYYNSLSCQNKQEEAIHYLKMSADDGKYHKAQYTLGCLYYNQKDFANALYYLRKSNEQGNCEAGEQLNHMYFQGHVPRII